MIAKRKYLICEYENGAGAKHFTAAERASFLGIGYWSTLRDNCMGYDVGPAEFPTFEAASERCVKKSRNRAASTVVCISRKEVEL